MKQTTPAGVSRCGARLPAASNVWAMACACFSRRSAPFPLQAFAGDEPKPPKQIGRFIHIGLPITGQTVARTRSMVRRAVDKARQDKAVLILVVEFDVPGGQKQGRARERFRRGLRPGELPFEQRTERRAGRGLSAKPHSRACRAAGHRLRTDHHGQGCDDRRGGNRREEPPAPDAKRLCRHRQSARETFPVVIALGMLDPAVEVLQVKTEVGGEYVTPEELATLKKSHATDEPVVVKRAGEQGEFSGAEARRWGFASYLAADRRDVAKALQLPSTAIEDDPSLDGGWKAVRVDLKGPLLADSVDKAQHMIEEQIRQEQVNFICLWIDSPGGSVADALRLANFLGDLDPSKVRTVAYVPSEARSDAAIIALACDQLVVHPRTVLGGSGRTSLAPTRSRTWSA